MSPPTEFFTISKVCEMTGLDAGRLAMIEEEMAEHMEIRRTRAGNRLFTEADVEQLQRVIRLLDDDGMDMEEVKATLFPPPEPPSDDDAEADGDAGADAAASTLPGLATVEDCPADGSGATPSGENGAPATEGHPAVPPLPVEPTVDLLLEAAEGLVQENLRLKAAVDALGERCLRLEEWMDEMSRSRSRWRFLRRF